MLHRSDYHAKRFWKHPADGEMSLGPVSLRIQRAPEGLDQKQGYLEMMAMSMKLIGQDDNFERLVSRRPWLLVALK